MSAQSDAQINIKGSQNLGTIMCPNEIHISESSRKKPDILQNQMEDWEGFLGEIDKIIHVMMVERQHKGYLLIFCSFLFVLAVTVLILVNWIAGLVILGVELVGSFFSILAIKRKEKYCCRKVSQICEEASKHHPQLTFQRRKILTEEEVKKDIIVVIDIYCADVDIEKQDPVVTKENTTVTTSVETVDNDQESSIISFDGSGVVAASSLKKDQVATSHPDSSINFSEEEKKQDLNEQSIETISNQKPNENDSSTELVSGSNTTATSNETSFKYDASPEQQTTHIDPANENPENQVGQVRRSKRRRSSITEKIEQSLIEGGLDFEIHSEGNREREVLRKKYLIESLTQSEKKCKDQNRKLKALARAQLEPEVSEKIIKNARSKSAKALFTEDIAAIPEDSEEKEEEADQDQHRRRRVSITMPTGDDALSVSRSKRLQTATLQNSIKTLKKQNKKLKEALKHHLGQEAFDTLYPSTSTGKHKSSSFKKNTAAPPSSSDHLDETDTNTKPFTTMSSEADSKFLAELQSAGQNFCVTDPGLPDNPIVYATQGFLKLTGYTLDQVLGRNCRFLQGPETDPDDVQKIREAVEKGNDVSMCLLNYRADGTTFWNLFHISALRDENGSILNFIGIQCEVSEAYALAARKRKNGQMVKENDTKEKLADHDQQHSNMFHLHVFKKETTASSA